ncbi:A/G-specific adenine glycosylase [Effusibacillus dendaii]|uniref:Adenine DNA glycosylase n=1 Tax=Effusibacillus dendaii TaxID=2743772 RepID=A0A7I8DGT8_9BACL|nr:A/G-specific adenine glycosylase [Effusibacillus dendaii]BCJ87011.1 A/G-specific adenine glycosylase [Effusibacillus dendaii]
MAGINHLEANEVAKRLLTWYVQNKRDLPWRRTKDPYQIWVSEVMLQQTRVESVIPYWNRFMERFPTVESLAVAPEEEVLKMWEGLGYYSRARNLQAAVREVNEKYGGRVPDSLPDMCSLPGVGPYTSGAVLSIAYNVSVPAVDGNVFRVLSRIFLIEDDVSKPAARKKFEGIAEFLIPPGEASDFNQALMEFGARICIPKHPRCETCPVQSLCRGYREGVQDRLPVKGKKKPPRPLDIATAIVWQRDRVLITRRPPEGLLAGMWEFPSCDVSDGNRHEAELTRFFQGKWDVGLQVKSHFANLQHTFSHLHWNVQAYTCEAEAEKIPETDSVKWVTTRELTQFAMPVVHQKLAKSLDGLL